MTEVSSFMCPGFALGVCSHCLLSPTGICSSQSRPHRTGCQRAGEGNLRRHSACCRGLVWELLRWGQLAGSQYEHCSTGGQPAGGAKHSRRNHTRTRTPVQSPPELMDQPSDLIDCSWRFRTWHNVVILRKFTRLITHFHLEWAAHQLSAHTGKIFVTRHSTHDNYWTRLYSCLHPVTRCQLHCGLINVLSFIHFPWPLILLRVEAYQLLMSQNIAQVFLTWQRAQDFITNSGHSIKWTFSSDNSSDGHIYSPTSVG